MFGKGGGALSTWIKEFCELVFIQTLQAFIYAIVIGFICTVLTDSAGLSADDKNTSVGIICVIALTAIFKVEDLARKIFGFGPTKADHGNAIASLAKTGFALKMGAKVLDNGKKLLTGAGAVARAPLQKLKAKNDMQAEKEAYLKDNNMIGDGSGGSKATASQSDINSARRQQIEAENYRQMAQKEKDPKKKQELEALSQNGAALPKDYYQKMRQFESNYKKEIKEINKNRREGIKNIARGVLESGGAVVGFTTGAIIGGADGNLGEAIQGGLTGMGAGDMIGKGMVDVPSSIIEYGEDVAKEIKGAVRKSSRSSSSVSTKLSTPQTTQVSATNTPNLSKVVTNYADERAKQDEETIKSYEDNVAKSFNAAASAIDDINKSGDKEVQSAINGISAQSKRAAQRLEHNLHNSGSKRQYGPKAGRRNSLRQFSRKPTNVGMGSRNAYTNAINEVKAKENKNTANLNSVDHLNY